MFYWIVCGYFWQKDESIVLGHKLDNSVWYYSETRKIFFEYPNF